MTNDDIRFKIDYYFSNSPADITFTDTIGLAGGYPALGLTTLDVEGLLSCSSPSGVFYINAGYVAEDFSAPDILGLTATWTKTTIALPLDADGNVIQGLYTFAYKVSEDGGTTVYTYSKSFTLSLTDSTVSIDLAMSCRTSILTSTDASPYTIVNNGTTYSYSSLTRAHAIVAPAGSLLVFTASTTDAVRTLGGGGTITTDMYTGTWITTVTTDLVYDIELWTAYWIVFHIEVAGQDTIDVECDDCYCCFRTCVANLLTKLTTYAYGTARYETIRRYLDLISYNWMLYEMASACGTSTETYCTAIRTIATYEDCTCSDSSDDTPTRVVAWGSGGTGTGTTTCCQWYSGAGTAVPAASSSNNGSFYLVNVAPLGIYTLYDILKSDGSAWTVIGNIAGAAGATTDLILYSNETDAGTPAGVGLTTLMTYTLGAGILATNGEEIVVEALMKLAINANQKTITITWGGNTVYTYTTAALITALDQYLTIKTVIKRVAVAEQDINTTLTRKNFVDGGVYSNQANNLALAQIINIDGQNAVASANDIVCMNMTVKYITKA